MSLAFNLPRLLLGSGALADLSGELDFLGLARPLLISDQGVQRAGLVDRVRMAAPRIVAAFLDVPENPTALGADAAAEVYRAANCDGVVALGGGSVLDTAKIVAGLVRGKPRLARDLIGRPERIDGVVPLVALPTTVGTGSESSPVAALHLAPGGPAIGTRHRLLTPRVAICDPDLARTLPSRLVAATAVDALSHCLEGFFAEPAHPAIDALALDGIARVLASARAALEPDGEAARASLMAAAFFGGAAIHKGLGPAHAVALACGDQDVHHGALIGVVLPHSTALLARHVPHKAARIAAAMGLADGADLAEALRALIADLDLPVTLAEVGYRLGDREALIKVMVQSPFNRTSPYAPRADDYRDLLARIEGH